MSFEKQPTLNGKLLTLRPLRGDDFQQLFAAAADPLLWEQHPDKNRYQESVFRKFFDAAIDSGGALIVIDARSGDTIGTSRFHAYSREYRSVEIGWTFLTRACWGGACNAELKSLMLSHAFEYIDKVVFKIGAENFRSQEATKKLGALQVDANAAATGDKNLVFELDKSRYNNLLKINNI